MCQLFTTTSCDKPSESSELSHTFRSVFNLHLTEWLRIDLLKKGHDASTVYKNYRSPDFLDLLACSNYSTKS